MTLTHESESKLRSALDRRNQWLRTGLEPSVSPRAPQPGRRFRALVGAFSLAILVGGLLAIRTSGSKDVDAPAAEAPGSATSPSEVAAAADSVAATPQARTPNTVIQPAAPQMTNEVGGFTEADIPAPESPGDKRTPIQRFIGVPADADAAAQWETDNVAQATVECMASKGFDYVPPDAPAGEGGAELPVAEAAALYGYEDGSGGCAAEASDRVHALNGLPGVAVEIVERVMATPAVADAVAAQNDCLAGYGYAKRTPDVPAEIVASCPTTDAAMYEANEQIEIAVMNAHYEYFVAFKAALTNLSS